VRLCAGVKIDQSPDTWMCSVGEDGKYTVKSGYIFLATNFFPPSDLNDEECMVLNNMWDSYAPLKNIIFNWQMLHLRLPTRENLMRRNTLLAAVDLHCPWCQLQEET
jgi:hypothetical protein